MISMTMKVLRFDSARVQRAMDAATHRALNKAGGWIRKTARRSIRRRKGTSEPGSPPRSHAGQLRDLLVYGYEPYAQTVVIGPLPFKEGEAPQLLEFGGTVARQLPHIRHGAPRRPGGRRRMVYAKRPFMAPALDKAVAQPGLVPGFWRNEIRGP